MYGKSFYKKADANRSLVDPMGNLSMKGKETIFDMANDLESILDGLEEIHMGMSSTPIGTQMPLSSLPEINKASILIEKASILLTQAQRLLEKKIN